MEWYLCAWALGGLEEQIRESRVLCSFESRGLTDILLGDRFSMGSIVTGCVTDNRMWYTHRGLSRHYQQTRD